jgi:F-type H+-transporting ATPase subunit b
MDELIKTFHIDWKLLIAQIINFAIVVAVLGFFAVKPLLKLMTDREGKIKKGVDDANMAQEELKNAEEIKEQKKKEGRIEAQVILDKAEKDSDTLRKDKVEKAQGEVKKVIEEAKTKILSDQDKMSKNVKENARGLVVEALNKITGGEINDKAHSQMIDKAIEEVQSVK